MTKKPKKLDNPTEPSILLATVGRMTTVVIAIEDYQPRENGQIPCVD